MDTDYHSMGPWCSVMRVSCFQTFSWLCPLFYAIGIWPGGQEIVDENGFAGWQDLIQLWAVARLFLLSCHYGSIRSQIVLAIKLPGLMGQHVYVRVKGQM